MVSGSRFFSFTAVVATALAQSSPVPAASSFVVPADFPTSIFSSYYYGPAPTKEPQPAIFDPVLNFTFPLNLTDPDTLPTNDTDAPILPPAETPAANATQAFQDAIARIEGIVDAKNASNCSTCVQSLQVLQDLSKQAPAEVPAAMVQLCEHYKLTSNTDCNEYYGLYTVGYIWTQIIRYGDIQGLDGRYMCYYISSTTCPRPVVDPPLNASSLFPKPKPKHAVAPKASGKRVKVAHLSDFHLDARYAVGAEANCSGYLCCRTDQYAKGQTANNASVELPAPLYGAYACDSPYFLGAGALQALHPLTGTTAKKGYGSSGDKKDQLAWTIYTGDLVSHEDQSQLSRAYTEYEETSIYSMFKSLITGPIFPVLGNHDTNPEAIDAPHTLPDGLANQDAWNYDHVAGVWQNDVELPASAVSDVRTHYGGYSVKNAYGLRILTLNTDFWYHSNVFNYFNATSHDPSGMLTWLISQLQDAEDAGERVWILGHVLTGWDGSNPLPNPTDLFYQIVDRYSPHVIANSFWGHTHEDHFMIYYANNGTNRNNSQGCNDALSVGWIGPSVTPLTNLNSGFRMYEVDTGDFNIYDAYTYYANVSSFSSLDTTKTGPTFYQEYSTRQAYGALADWPDNAPLNATFWHKVTEGFEAQAQAGNLTATELFNAYQGKMSVKSPQCNTTACALAKVCYMRSGSQALGHACPQGYGSVQSAFKPSS